MARLESSELNAVRWFLGQMLVLISLSGSYSLDLGADLLISAGLLLTLGASLFPGIAERLPRLLWRILPAFLLVAIVSDFILSAGDVLPPLFRMVLILTLFRALQIRTCREDLQLLLLTLFLLVVTGVLSQEITFGIQMLVFAPIAMGLLFVVNLSSPEPGSAMKIEDNPVFHKFSWRSLVRHLRQRMDYRTLGFGMLIFLMMTGLSLVLFILMPRFDIGAALPFPRLNTSQSLTGFTDHVEYGDVVSILNDESIAMRVDVQADNPPARPYWRMVVLDAYYDGGFMVSPKVARDHRRLQHFYFEYPYLRNLNRDDSVWTIYLEGGISSYLPTGDTFGNLRFKNRTTLQLHDLTHVFQGTEINASTLSLRYTGLNFNGNIPMSAEDGFLLDYKPGFIDTADTSYLKDVSYPETLLVLPDGNANRRILQDALSRIGYNKRMEVEEFATRAIRMLQQDRGYTLESRIPEGDADRLLRWVASEQPGHCELYAGAMVLISRAAGIPARLVTGFVGGDWNGYENYFMVRNRNAHAWCELFKPGEGWIRVDPTPGYATDPGSVDAALAQGGLLMDRTLKAYLDSLRILWFRRVIQFDGEDQQEMAELVKDAGTVGFSWLSARFKELRDRLGKDLEAFRQHGDVSGLVGDFLPILLMVAVLISLIVLLRKNRKRKGFEELMRRRAGKYLKLLSMKADGVSGEQMCALQLIRYGPVSSWPEKPARFMSDAVRSGKRG